MDKPYCATGPTIFVGATPVQIAGLNHPGATFRVYNLSTTKQSLTWGPTSSVASLTPGVGVNALNTLSFLPTSVETIGHLGLWAVASSASGFEITQGDGV